MEILFAALEVFGEILLQLVFEGLAELGLRSAQQWLPARRTIHPVAAAAGHVVLGAVAAVISLLFFRHAIIHSLPWRIANLIVTPVAAGFAMSLLGAWRERRGQMRIRLDRFGYAFLFAFTMALIRFLATRQA